MDRLSMMLFKVQCRHHSLREVSMALIFPPPEIPLAFVVIIFISVNDLHAVDCCLVYYGGFHEILANLITYFKYSHISYPHPDPKPSPPKEISVILLEMFLLQTMHQRGMSVRTIV